MNGLWMSTGSKLFGAYNTQSESAGSPSGEAFFGSLKSSRNSTAQLCFGKPCVLEPRT